MTVPIDLPPYYEEGDYDIVSGYIVESYAKPASENGFVSSTRTERLWSRQFEAREIQQTFHIEIPKIPKQIQLKLPAESTGLPPPKRRIIELSKPPKLDPDRR